MKNKLLILIGIILICLSTGCSSTKVNDSITKSESGDQRIIHINPDSDNEEGKRYNNLADAFSYVNANPPTSEKERITIEISAGTYRECITLTAPYITLKPSDKDSDVKLTFYYGAGNHYSSLNEESSIANSASTHIEKGAHDFIADNIIFENSYNIYVSEEEKNDITPDCTHSPVERSQDPSVKKFQTQAVALRIDADRCIFRNCKFYGRQDTLYFTNAARLYFKDCYVEGTADFICGDATAVFQSCTLNCPYNSGYVTASSSSSENPYGYLFKDCTITKNTIEGREAPQDGDYALGRPWRSAPQVIFWNCKMGSHIAIGKYRFVAMTKEYPCQPCRFIECNSMDLSGYALDMTLVAASFETIATESEMQEKYNPEKHLAAKFNPETKQLEKADNWNPK